MPVKKYLINITFIVAFEIKTLRENSERQLFNVQPVLYAVVGVHRILY